MNQYPPLSVLDTDEYVSTGHVEHITKIKRGTLEQMRCRGVGIPFVRIGRCVRYRVGDIKEFLARSRVEVSHEITA